MDCVTSVTGCCCCCSCVARSVNWLRELSHWLLCYSNSSCTSRRRWWQQPARGRMWVPWQPWLRCHTQQLPPHWPTASPVQSSHLHQVSCQYVLIDMLAMCIYLCVPIYVPYIYLLIYILYIMIFHEFIFSTLLLYFFLYSVYITDWYLLITINNSKFWVRKMSN